MVSSREYRFLPVHALLSVEVNLLLEDSYVTTRRGVVTRVGISVIGVGVRFLPSHWNMDNKGIIILIVEMGKIIEDPKHIFEDFMQIFENLEFII